MSLEDSAMNREVLREIAKHPVDSSGLDVHVTHGVAYIRGRIEKTRGYYEDVDLHEELLIMLKALRQKPGIRDIVCEVDVGGPTLRERMSPHVKRSQG